jgi:hypothetical protein
VHEVRARQERDEHEHHRGVEEPGAEVEPAQRALPHPGREESPPHRVAHRRPRRPPGLHRGEPAALHHEARHVDHEQDEEGVGEAGVGIHAGGALDEAAVARHAEPDDEEEAEEVQHELVEQVEVALEDLHAEQRQREVVVDGGEHRAHEQREEAPEHGRVHDARIGLREHPRLEETIGDEAPDPRERSVPAHLRLAPQPETHALGDAPHEGGDRDRRPRVQRDLRPRRDIPERVAEWEIAVERVHGPNRIRWGSRVVKRSGRGTQTRPTTLGCDGEAIEPRGLRGR